jgi:hypothetical protein
MNPMICSSVNLLLRIALPLRCADIVRLRWGGIRGAGHLHAFSLHVAVRVEGREASFKCL